MQLQAQTNTTLVGPDSGMGVLRISMKVPIIICEEVAPPQEDCGDCEATDTGTGRSETTKTPTVPRLMNLLTVPSVDPSVERRSCDYSSSSLRA